MSYEVEQKFRVNDFDSLRRRLDEMGVVLGPPIEQVDCYFRHPSRDFASTDEAFRLRRIGNTNLVTYKGPKIDTTTKTRFELELPLPDGLAYAGEFTKLLESLSFEQVTEVRKTRRESAVPWQGAEVVVVLDEVDGVGRFVELEFVTDEENLESAKRLVTTLAIELDLKDVESRSYLELLLLRITQE